jgi:2,3-bisphosphoglycerate-independent phosphoglycerate mutase
MDRFELISRLKQSTSERIVLLVLDGLGGLPVGGKTELESAHTPNLDRLAGISETGLMVPILRGITPGSGPGHLALFGYDPLTYLIGRGILSALGVKFPVRQGDLAARVNFATVDDDGNVTDRAKQPDVRDDPYNRHLRRRILYRNRKGTSRGPHLQGLGIFGPAHRNRPAAYRGPASTGRTTR